MRIGILDLPGRRLLLFIVIFSLLPFIPIVYKIAAAPPGTTYAYYIDEHIFLAGIKSYSFGYLDPYGPLETLIFKTPFLASVYLFAFMGLFARIIDAAFLLHLFTFLFSIIYFVASYNLISLFVKDKTKQIYAFLFSAFASGGAAGLLYLFARGPIESINTSAFQHLLWSAGLAPLSVIYFAGSLAFGYLSLLYFIKGTERRHALLSSVFLGIAMLIYPLFGLASLLLISTCALVTKNLWRFVKIIPITAFIASPWLIFRSEYYNHYLSSASFTNPLVFLVHGFLVLPLAVVCIYSMRGGFVEKLKTNRMELFLIIWTLIILILAFAPKDLVRVPVQRFIYMMWLPLSILAFLGLDYISNNVGFLKKIGLKTLTSIAIIITIITFIFWYPAAFQPADVYFPQHEIEALKFLKNQPEGMILAGYDLSLRAPYFAEKRALRGGGPGFEKIPFIGPLEDDYTTFFGANSTEEQRKGILKKYEISYVIFSDQERAVSGGAFSPDTLPFLEKISGNETNVYRVLA